MCALVCVFGFRRSGRELPEHGGRAATAADYVPGLRKHAGAVQPGSARLEGHHAARVAVRKAQRTGHAAGDGHPNVGATGHGNTRRARRTQLTTVSIIAHTSTHLRMHIIIDGSIRLS